MNKLNFTQSISKVNQRSNSASFCCCTVHNNFLWYHFLSVAPPNTLPLSGSRPMKKKVLAAPALSLSLGKCVVELEAWFSSFVILSFRVTSSFLVTPFERKISNVFPHELMNECECNADQTTNQADFSPTRRYCKLCEHDTQQFLHVGFWFSGHSESTVSDDFPSAFLSPSPDDDNDMLDFDLDAMETPSDSESLHMPICDLDLGVRGQTSKGKRLWLLWLCAMKLNPQDCFQTTFSALVWPWAIGERWPPVPDPGLILLLTLDQDQEKERVDWELWSRRT